MDLLIRLSRSAKGILDRRLKDFLTDPQGLNKEKSNHPSKWRNLYLNSKTIEPLFVIFSCPGRRRD